MSAIRAVSEQILDLLKPPRRVSVSECCAENLYAAPGVLWNPDAVPYMIRPMDETASRRNRSVCFVGPARTGKTLALVLGRYVYTVIAHPLDFAIIHSSKDLARRLSLKELKRQTKDSDLFRSKLSLRASDNNTFDATLANGVFFVLGWPSKSQLASQTIPVILITDYGRWPIDVGGEGSGFAQAQKRTQTAGSLAMTVVESSPRETVAPDVHIDPPIWQLGKPIDHGFPPTVSGRGASICPVFNAGTREWWYVPCMACGEFYPQNPSIYRFSWAIEEKDPVKASRHAGTICPWCGSVHGEKTKAKENQNGVWLAEGEVIDCYGKVTGESRKGHADPSFAIGGGAATYQKRKDIVRKYLQAQAEFADTGSDYTLKTVVNQDIGGAYESILTGAVREKRHLQERSGKYEKRLIPQGVRFLIAAVDVQKDRFVVQVMGYGPDRNRWVIDYYGLRHTARGKDSCDPASYDEDWDMLPKILGQEKAYALADASGRKMLVAGLVVDSGGAAGVTDKAYAFFRRLDINLKDRIRLLKGESKRTAYKLALVEERYPDTFKVNARGASRGDVPVFFINNDRIKDRLDGDLRRNEPGPGFTHFPGGLGDWFYDGLTREKRDASGKWSSAVHNEPWDLICYGEGAAVMGLPFSARPQGIDTDGFWDAPPEYAQDWKTNSLLIGGNVKRGSAEEHVLQVQHQYERRKREYLW